MAAVGGGVAEVARGRPGRRAGHTLQGDGLRLQQDARCCADVTKYGQDACCILLMGHRAAALDDERHDDGHFADEPICLRG